MRSSALFVRHAGRRRTERHWASLLRLNSSLELMMSLEFWFISIGSDDVTLPYVVRSISK